MLPSISSCGDRGAADRKHLRVLLPFTSDSLRIPDELAADIGAEEALVVAPFGKGRVRPVEVGEDGDGAFLGRGWSEFAGACGIRAGWFLVLRHHGSGVLTVKVFDASCCLTELTTRAPAVGEPMSSTEVSRRPQFISVLTPDSIEKLPIPAKFVQNYISKGHMNNCIAVLYVTLGKICQIEIKMNGLDTFFSGGWSQFLALHGITASNCLLLRYEGNMTFTVKVFGSNGCQLESKHNGDRMQLSKENIKSTLPDIEKQQESPSASIQKCERKKDQLCSEERKRPKTSMTSIKKAPFQKKSYYEIGPPSWIKKMINTSTLKHHLSLSKGFCNAIGLREPCMITLKTSMDSTESWQVYSNTNKNSSYRLSQGWKKFCQENSLKQGRSSVGFAPVSIGTPPVSYSAIVDTGSDLIWTQCAPCDADTFSLNDTDGTGGFVIDSGTTVASLVDAAYQQVRAAVESLVTTLFMVDAEDSTGLDASTCAFALPASTSEPPAMPSMTLHFDGAGMVIPWIAT